jgi:hypothetical protein
MARSPEELCNALLQLDSEDEVVALLTEEGLLGCPDGLARSGR